VAQWVPGVESMTKKMQSNLLQVAINVWQSHRQNQCNFATCVLFVWFDLQFSLCWLQCERHNASEKIIYCIHFDFVNVTLYPTPQQKSKRVRSVHSNSPTSAAIRN